MWQRNLWATKLKRTRADPPINSSKAGGSGTLKLDEASVASIVEGLTKNLREAKEAAPKDHGKAGEQSATPSGHLGTSLTGHLGKLQSCATF